MSKVITIKLNPKQAKFLKSRARRKSFIGGRGSGKSMTMGFQIRKLFPVFPRATWVIAGLTYVSIDSIVIPNIREALEKCGLFEYDKKLRPYGVYVIGVQPPDTWAKPYKQPGKRLYQYCITFINGFTLRLVSQDNKETHRGLSINGLLVDESATISFEFIQTVLIPAFRGNTLAPYEGHYWNYGFFDFSSASWTIAGNWIYDTEEKYFEMCKERKSMYESHGEQWLIDNVPEFLFLESTYEDNQRFLPAKYGQMQRETLDIWKYNVEVMNQRVLKLPNQYYHALSEANFYFKSYDYHPRESGVLEYSHNDYHKDKPLLISLDFNADIVWCLVCQQFGNEFRVIQSEFKKPEVTKVEQESNILIQLAEWFCKTYDAHAVKEVYVFGDPNGNSTSASTDKSNRPFFDRFCEILIKKDWKVFRKELTSYPKTKDRYDLMNMMFSGSHEKAPKVRINKNTNKSFIIALQNTLVTTDKLFKKDKSSERKARFREYATDPTDAFDYILWSLFSHFINRGQYMSETGVVVR
ncbi:hypothetical protein MCERE19_02227 [Spirosomataceae bacterium]